MVGRISLPLLGSPSQVSRIVRTTNFESYALIGDPIQLAVEVPSAPPAESKCRTNVAHREQML